MATRVESGNEESDALNQTVPKSADDNIDNIPESNTALEPAARNQKCNCRYCPRTKKMKCCLGVGIFVALIVVATACLFRNPTLFMYPLHAACNITWTFQDKCDGVANKLITQMEVWKTNATCGTGQKCLYTFESYEGNTLKGIHTTPKAGYIDDMEYKFYPNTGSGGCNLVGYSTSRIFFAVLDFGTNYCNLHNLVEGSGLMSDAHYSELTRDEICTQYTSANCDKY